MKLSRILRDIILSPSILLVFGASPGCTYDTEESVNNSSVLLPNGKHLAVAKTTRETTSRGYLTDHDYGTPHNFTYHLSVDHDDVTWDGGSGEPKNIAWHNDTIYRRYLKRVWPDTAQDMSFKDATSPLPSSETIEAYQKYIDERYFFRLLGQDYRVDVSPEEYASLLARVETYAIPNDGELNLE